MTTGRRLTTSAMLLLPAAMLVVACLPAKAQQVSLHNPYVVQARSFLEFHVRSGHILATAPQRRSYRSPLIERGVVKEHASVEYDYNNMLSTFTYTLTSPEENVTVTAKTNGRVVVRREAGEKGDAVPCEFVQPPSGPMTFTFGKGPEKTTVTAATIWHLLLAQREGCEKHLLPLLAVLKPDWRLPAMADQVERELVAVAARPEQPERRHWAELVAQLGDDRYTRREAADRELRSQGHAVAAYLRSLQPDRLDAEQRYRIHRILQSMTATPDEESPSQVAASLVHDPAIWLSLLESDAPKTRQAAARQLEELLESPIDFDPRADEATRRRQIDELRKQIAGGAK